MFIVLILTLIYLLSNAVTLRRDLLVFFEISFKSFKNKAIIAALIYWFIEGLISIYILNKGLGLHGGLLHITNITQIFQIFIYLISILILQFTCLVTIVLIPKHLVLKDIKFLKRWKNFLLLVNVPLPKPHIFVDVPLQSSLFSCIRYIYNNMYRPFINNKRGGYFNLKVKVKFFDYSSPNLYNVNMNLDLMKNRVLSVVKRKFIFNWKKMLIILFSILLGIILKSICQYILGAEETSVDKLIVSLDYPFYLGSLFGGWILVILQDNWNNFTDNFFKNIRMKLDSGDENSEDEAVKISWKGKEKITDNTTSTDFVAPTRTKDVDVDVNVKLTLEERIDRYYTNELSVLSKISTNTQRINFVSGVKLTSDQWAMCTLTAQGLNEDTKEAIIIISKITEQVEASKAINLNKIDINDKFSVDNFVIGYLLRYARLYNDYIDTRVTWLKCRIINLDPHNSKQVIGHLLKVDDSKLKLQDIITKVKNIDNSTKQSKVFYALLNEQKKIISIELEQGDIIAIKDLKNSPFCLLKHVDCKNFTQSLKDYNKIKEKFNSEDNYLKKKIGEMINK